MAGRRWDAVTYSEFFEVPVPRGSMDLEVVSGIGVDPDGYVNVPAGPGLGLEVDRDKVRALTVDRIDVEAPG